MKAESWIDEEVKELQDEIKEPKMERVQRKGKREHEVGEDLG